MSYEIAQQRVAEARRNDSPRLNLSSLALTELPPGSVLKLCCWLLSSVVSGTRF